MTRWLRLSLFLLVASLGWSSSPRELIPGLPYFRITDYMKEAAEVQTALTKDAVVIDLRSTAGSSEAAIALTEHLEEARVSQRGIRLILINPSTSPEIVKALSKPRPRQLTLGPRAPELTPDIAVASSAEEDRRAYDALASGTPLEKLISSITDKKRFDEAALVRSRAGLTSPALETEPDVTTAVESAATSGQKENQPVAPPPPHDLVLERAVQIYRALLVAKR